MLARVFGLGWIELLVIAAAVSLLAGPVALRRLVATARSVEKVKSDLTGPNALRRLMDDAPDDDERDQ